MSPERRRFENQRSRSRAQHYAVGSGAFRRAQPVRRLRPADRPDVLIPAPTGSSRAHVKERLRLGTIPVSAGNIMRATPTTRVTSCSVPAMFAHSTRTWWWTAHPAAH
ncbi:trp operon leader peptide [Streptomyces griseoloalbus]